MNHSKFSEQGHHEEGQVEEEQAAAVNSAQLEALQRTKTREQTRLRPRVPAKIHTQQSVCPAAPGGTGREAGLAAADSQAEV